MSPTAPFPRSPAELSPALVGKLEDLNPWWSSLPAPAPPALRRYRLGEPQRSIPRLV